MTSEEAPVASDEELAAELKALLVRAHDGGVDVEGGWECRNGPDYPDWDVLVTEVAKSEGSE